MQIHEAKFALLPESAMLAVLSRAVLRAELPAWQAGRIATPNTQIGRTSGTIVHLAGELGLKAAGGQADTGMARPAHEALRTLMSWVGKSTGLPDSLRRSWRAATGAANLLALQVSGDRSFMKERGSEALFDACQALLYAQGFGAGGSALHRQAVAAVNADIVAAGARSFDLRRFLTGPLWPKKEPADELWSFAKAGATRDVAAGGMDPRGWDRKKILHSLAALEKELEKSPPIETVEESAEAPAEAPAGAEGESAASVPKTRRSPAKRAKKKSSKSSWKRAKPPDRSAPAAQPLPSGPVPTLAPSARGRSVSAASRAKAAAPGSARKSALHKPARAKSGAKRGRAKGGASPSAAHPAGYVNTGFASHARPQEFLDQRQTLRTSERCWFALQIGELLEGIAAGQPVNIPAGLLPARAQLEVALFSFPNEIELGPGSTRGALELGSDGVGSVLRQPVEGLRGKEERDLKALLGKQEIWKQRLFFPVQMGPRPGPQRLRCSLYYKQTLVHSRVVQVLTRKGAGSSLPGPVDGSISFKTDYLLTRKLSADSLTGFKENDLSLMLNGTDGTHQLRVFGKHDVQEDVHFSSATLDTLVRELRAVLRAAAWGDIEEWSGKPGVQFRYGGTQTLDQLGADLVTMARAGRRCFDVLRRTANAKLSGQGQRLESLVSEPSYIQFASRTTSSELVPVAVLYDRPLDPNDPHLTLCSAFTESLADPALPDLEDSRCWKGQCPSRDKDTVVCPSGFWGFRHYLGLPLTIDGASGAGSTGAASDLGCTAEPRLTVAVSTDPQFSMREQHVAQIRQLFPGVGLADSREKTLAALTGSPGHVAYFYCHGDYVGLRKDIPALLVGPVTSARIDASLISQRVRWEGVRPLVFLNGCRTTALLPSQSFGMVSAFVQDANAAGVIGTEITIFEPLATRFGMEFLRGLLEEELEVGVAMRRARLKLLKEKNPLGLVYISFALSRLRLRTV